LENLGDIDAQTIAGAVSTGTHGTGARMRGLADQVHAVRMVDATGEVVEADRQHRSDLFEMARLGLGSVGVLRSEERRAGKGTGTAGIGAPCEEEWTATRRV